ncbi:DUF2202 domain-containing protein [Cloacibacterium normanense]
MKLVFAFFLSLFLVSCSLMQPRTARTTSQLSEKEIITITQLIGKEKIAKEVYENFYAQYQNNLFGNIAKRKQKHIEIWKNILAKQNITVLENESLEETENLKNQLLSEAIDETSALKTAIKIEELNLNDLYDVEKILNETKAGKHFGYDEKENLKKFFLESYQNWKLGTLNQNAENIEQFSRKNLTQKLVDLMNKI